MKWVVIAIAALGVSALGLGRWTEGRADTSEYAIAAATVFYVPGLILLGIDVVILVGWGIERLLFG